jgi:hypothetical protein
MADIDPGLAEMMGGTVHRLTLEGFDKGRREGFDEGLDKGLDKSRELLLLLLLLEQRFGSVSAAIAARVDSAGGDVIKDWFTRALTARSLDEVFAG